MFDYLQFSTCNSDMGQMVAMTTGWRKKLTAQGMNRGITSPRDHSAAANGTGSASPHHGTTATNTARSAHRLVERVHHRVCGPIEVVPQGCIVEWREIEGIHGGTHV